MFILFFLLFYPIYDSAEDTHVLYMLGGGYGDPPTEMAHFNYGIHPILGWTVKSLFELNNGVNWYSVMLILAHYISCTVILTIIIRKRNTVMAYLAYAVLFLAFEGYFLLFMDFTASSAVLGVTALLYLLVHAWERDLCYRHCIVAGLLFLFASFYRIHSILPLLAIALPFFVFTVSKDQNLRSLIVVLASGICILAFNFIHTEWYTAKKADWPQEDTYRQAVFRFFNEGSTIKVPAAGEKWYAPHKMVTGGMIMDTSLVPITRIDSMYHDLKKQGTIHWNLSPGWRKWFYINNRLFFAVLLAFIVLYGLRRKIIAPALISVLLMTLGFFFLVFNYKAPSYILVSSMMLIAFPVFLYGHESISLQKKQYRLAAIIILLLLMAWSIVRLYRTSDQNRDVNWLFKVKYAEIAAHPDILYIGLNGSYSNKFYVFDLPVNYPFTNYLHAESFLTGNYKSVIRRFNIPGIKNILSAPNVLIRGNISADQAAYFEQLAGRRLQFRELTEYKNLRTWKVVAEQSEINTE